MGETLPEWLSCVSLRGCNRGRSRRRRRVAKSSTTKSKSTARIRAETPECRPQKREQCAQCTKTEEPKKDRRTANRARAGWPKSAELPELDPKRQRSKTGITTGAQCTESHEMEPRVPTAAKAHEQDRPNAAHTPASPKAAGP